MTSTTAVGSRRIPGVRTTAPGPEGLDMVRSIGRMRRDTLGFLADCSARYGPVTQFPIPRTPAYFVDHPDAVRHVLQTNHRGYGKRTIQYDALALVTGRGLLTNDGDSWMRQRRLAQLAFHNQRLHEIGAHVDTSVVRLLGEWDERADGGVVDVDEAMMRVALEVVGRSLFSTDFSDDADALMPAVLSALDVVVQRAQSFTRLPMSVPTPANRRMRRAVDTIDAAVQSLLAGRRDDPGEDLLGAYLRAESDGRRMSEREVRDEVVTLVVAGHETVASSLAWTWLLLAQHPTVQTELHAEVDEVLGGRAPGYDDLVRLPFTAQVVHEALRLYPPAWVVTRRALADDVVVGHDVPRGSLVVLSPWVTQRNPSWWPDPDRFDPGRWTPAGRAGHVRGASFPFGAGPNLCIGRDFALVESVLVLAHVAQRYAVEEVPGHVVVAEPLVTIRPAGGLPLRVHRRTR